MISSYTKVENNQFEVSFDFSPESVAHVRTNNKGTYWAVHEGSGTTRRQGIWEGLEIVEVWTKIGDGAWRSHANSSWVTVSTGDNNVQIQAKAKYRLRTMGYHWNDFSGTYPFFWFGNFSGNPNKYANGYFTDSAPSAPSNVHYYCVVPSDWSFKWCDWSDWTYKHGSSTNNWAIAQGRYEQRNANYESARDDNGWVAESGNKQMWRKSSMFYFEKEYSTSVISSGIATNPNNVEITVHPAKGDGGNITVKYTDNAGIDGKMWINASCGDKVANVLNWDNSWTFRNGESRDIYVDFNNAFGEGYRGNDVYYTALAVNNIGYYSPSWTGPVGVHRYNGRPTKPTDIYIEGVDGIIYNKIRINWRWGWDPDGDWIVYDLWAKVTSKDGRVLRDDYIARGYNGLSMEYDISNFPEESVIQIFVRCSDNAIVSDWADPVSCTKGAVPKGNIVFLAPCASDVPLYNKRARFVFDGTDGASEFVIAINGQEYSSKYLGHLFHRHGSKIVFKPNFDLPDMFNCYAFMRNEYGCSSATNLYYYSIRDASNRVSEDNVMTAKSIKEMQSIIADFGRAFNKVFNYESAEPDNIMTARLYNSCHDFLNSVLWDINNLTPGSPFEYALHCWPVEPGQTNDDALWNKLMEELSNI